MTIKKRVLFICVHNTARSQIAEAWLNMLGGNRYEAESAGLEPGTIKPQVVEVMREVGVDLSGKGSQTVFELTKSGRLFHYVVGLCNVNAMERCPIFPGGSKRLNWSIPDRDKTVKDKEEELEQFRMMRDALKKRVEEWLATNP